MAAATPEGLTVHAKCKVTQRISWTTPTVVETTLCVRDRKHIMALDLGVPETRRGRQVIQR